MSFLRTSFLFFRKLGARGTALIALPQRGLQALLQEAAERAQEDDEAGDQAGDLRGIDRQVDIEPKGLRPPRKATAMPLKPMPGTEEIVVSQSSMPVR